MLQLAASGTTVWAAGALWFVLRAGTTPDLLGVWLPGMVLLAAIVSFRFTACVAGLLE